jgi:Lrp/AsnC family leucine-responsive transcriptional regulator
MRTLDAVDRQILEILQKDGRITMTDLAVQIGLSATPCTERVRRLERDGIISGYHARVNPHSLGQSILVFIEVRLAAKSREILTKVRESFDEIADIMECHLVSGDFDYLLKARLGAMSEYNELLCRLHALLPATVDCRSYVVMEEMKESLYVCP